MAGRKIIVVGAGPGGLAAGMILAHRGFDVEIFEEKDRVGGRNSAFTIDGFTFDLGPTFLMMKFILDEVFEESGTSIDDHLRFSRLDPLYRLSFSGRTIDVTGDHEAMARTIEAAFPGNGEGYRRFLAREKVRYERMYPCLQKSYSKFRTYFHPDFLKAIPHLSLGRSMHQELGRYFTDEDLKIAFTFQSKYLGMSPWSCPAAFMIIPFVEHAFGIWHPIGGLSELAVAMARVFETNGGTLRLNSKVARLDLSGREAKGVVLEDGRRVAADAVIVNADFSHAMTHLVPDGVLRKYDAAGLARRNYSCSTFMLYLGVDGAVDLPHHTIFFSRDYRAYIQDVAAGRLGTDISFYVRNASVTDPTIAPEGKSGIYVLVPVPNRRSGIDWSRRKKEFRDLVVRAMEAQAPLSNLSGRIVAERVITPDDWETDWNVHIGATFNLAHNLGQMLHYRPRNEFEEISSCYLTGGGTHPGSGLPTIYESGRITANLISRRFGVPFSSRNTQI